MNANQADRFASSRQRWNHHTGESLFDEMANQVIKRLRSDKTYAALARRRAEIQLQHLFGKSILRL